ncbi:4-hydroxy-tetrahydrodipicolinate synthase [Alkaliphilus peptidifermentans]|uniref:4-hydroxy-tetrahydrodipicolinate synthase n=1 Tax=Alkaliphilus peptidifermentans DSM 18978 TaxID=1120976 RepID=A0A1G5KXS4_9FIRM|nr:4-hydroxy-tetrahydrodipicolinate synthase [Alkaliphilus peptidifermentans]SCZ05405.1 4-hydroxy-tetrahydrodipicolinate synthase [Alkaliphilus peptidifermentans DSM 18978]
MSISGIWLPIVTPFKDDKVDFKSLEGMINHYIPKGISGLIPLGTTGESPTVSDIEFEEIVEKTVEFCNNRVPIFVGVGGNDTKKVIQKLKLLEKYNVKGILSVSPYYNRPDQRGILQHFSSIAASTDLDIIVYNIPYRTGRNIENSTIHKLAEIKNIVALKDASGDIKQTLELLLNPPKDFSILTGEDAFYYTTLLHGGHGGILASCHLETELFIEIYNQVKENNYQAAFENWKKLIKVIPHLFEEPNPTPIKYCLYKLGLIEANEVRLPLLPITEALQAKLDILI